MRFLKRLAIWLRWPMAIAAIAVIGLILLTRAQALDGTVKVLARSWTFSVSDGLLYCETLLDSDRNGKPIYDIQWRWIDPIDLRAWIPIATPGDWLGVRIWGSAFSRVVITLPILASLCAVLSLIGFWLRRRDERAAIRPLRTESRRRRSLASRISRAIGSTRWIALGATVILFAGAVGSYIWDLHCNWGIPPGGISLWIEDTTAVFGAAMNAPRDSTSRSTGPSLTTEWSRAFLVAHVRPRVPSTTQAYALPVFQRGVGGCSLTAPSWMLPLPTAILALVGFLLHRRESKPGECLRCGYALAGAAVCPECGATAPHASAPPSSP